MIQLYPRVMIPVKFTQKQLIIVVQEVPVMQPAGELKFHPATQGLRKKVQDGVFSADETSRIQVLEGWLVVSFLKGFDPG